MFCHFSQIRNASLPVVAYGHHQLSGTFHSLDFIFQVYIMSQSADMIILTMVYYWLAIVMKAASQRTGNTGC